MAAKAAKEDIRKPGFRLQLKNLLFLIHAISNVYIATELLPLGAVSYYIRNSLILS